MRADELHPDLAAAVAEIESLGLPAWNDLSVAAARRLEDDLFSGPPEPPVAEVRDLAFDGPHGEVPVRVYRPESAAGTSEDATPSRALVHLHGGGWTLGTLDSVDGICRELSDRADAVVVSVDYRLAPEHPFPVAVDEAAAAVEWVAATTAALGVDPERIGVSGTSAGGALAVAAALRAREFGDLPEPAGQFLLYPIAGHDFETDSYRKNADGPLLTRDDMRWFYDRYLRSPVDAANPYAVPLEAADLGDLPPATVVTAGFDPLRDDGVALAERFEREGTPVEHRHYPAMAHGFCSLADRVDAGEAALEAVAGDVRDRL
ncbi:alpha/beta hydrolase fold-3 domain protein [Halorubrum californiense DSM 19288]|uniref:Alpha/beta hydrolase fold-3 domain protein n=1 Tax=Halorubrum californiense DSM 19288 TaxID=1227465 RepID=M0E518_9EURY|nr:MULTISPECIES: alpha/beta hydrolase [Halorubrum]ELZ42143.1 alpha/beta hydrolase fold-3 domain protein [Halorubrum californiense DSM 19288]TKX70918.1 alpha/beta hydrolase [Halorubrum sp. GN11GM_10-3_MGM]